MSSFDLSWVQWLLIFGCGLLVGLSKTGIAGISMIAIPVLAHIFGGKLSTGVLLPMLIMADFFAVFYFRQYARWDFLIKLLPWSLAGIMIGTYIGNQINDEQFKLLMGGIIIISIIIMVWRDVKGIQDIPDFWWFSMIMGLLAGFTTMVGNLAGAITAIYFLSMQLPKNTFIGTGAWFYLIVNVLKVPFHIFSWETITLHSFQLNLYILPAIALGAVLGVRIVKYFSNTAYRKFVIAVTLISAALLFV